jgi:hypothetical protein
MKNSASFSVLNITMISLPSGDLTMLTLGSMALSRAPAPYSGPGKVWYVDLPCTPFSGLLLRGFDLAIVPGVAKPWIFWFNFCLVGAISLRYDLRQWVLDLRS